LRTCDAFEDRAGLRGDIARRDDPAKVVVRQDRRQVDHTVGRPRRHPCERYVAARGRRGRRRSASICRDFDLDQRLHAQQALDDDGIYGGPVQPERLAANLRGCRVMLDTGGGHVLDDTHDLGETLAARFEDGGDLRIGSARLLSHTALDDDIFRRGIVFRGRVAREERPIADLEAERERVPRIVIPGEIAGLERYACHDVLSPKRRRSD
jgi:hypothetical protein